MGKLMKDGMSRFAIMLLMASGADIVAPKELKRQAIEALDLEDNSNFASVDEKLKQVETQKEKLAIIKAMILTHLTPSQMISLHELIHLGVTTQIEYLKDHPEEKGKAVEPDEAMERLAEFDSL